VSAFEKVAQEKMSRMADLVIKKHTRDGLTRDEMAELSAIVLWRTDTLRRI
jgi:hypothetical protein